MRKGFTRLRCCPLRRGLALHPSPPRRTSGAGFTLIELLLVIGIIAILASIVIVAVNPSRQLAQARNTERRNEVNTLLNAINQFEIDNNGTLPGCLPTATAGTAYNVCTANDCTGVTNGCNLNALVGTYVVGIPTDPSYASGLDTLYDVSRSTGGRVTVNAPSAELNATISVTR